MMFLVLLLPIFLENSVAADVQDESENLALLEDLNNTIPYLTKLLKDVDTSLTRLPLQVSIDTQKSLHFILVKKKLDRAIRNGQPVDACEIILQDKYEQLINKVSKEISETIRPEFEKIKKDLESVQKRINESLNTFKSNSIFDINTYDRDYRAIENIRVKLNDIENERNSYVYGADTLSGIVDWHLIVPVNECLKNSKVTEYKGN